MLNDIDPAETTVTLYDGPFEVACIVDHVYAGDRFVIDFINLQDCNRMAVKYDMPQLRRAVDAFVQQLELTDHNLPSWMKVAHGDPELPQLRERCIQYASERLLHVLRHRIR